MKKGLRKTLSLLLLTTLLVCALSLGAFADSGELVEIEPNPSVELFYLLSAEGKTDAPAVGTELDTPDTGDEPLVVSILFIMLFSLCTAAVCVLRRDK